MDTGRDEAGQARARAARADRAALLGAVGVFLGALALLGGFLAQAPGLALLGALALVLGLASGADWLRLRGQR